MKKHEIYAESFRNRILNLLDSQKDHSLTLEEVAANLEVRHGARKHLRSVLERMTLAGDILRARENKYALGRQMELVTGLLQVARSGEGFVSTPQGGQDVRVARGTLGTALPGDKVVVRLNRKSSADADDRRSGVILRVEERRRRVIAGTVKTVGTSFHVVPIDPAFNREFFVPDPKGAAPGDRVVIRFVDWENQNANPKAEILEVIGPADQPSLDTITIIRHHGFAEEFPAEVAREAEEAAMRMEEQGKREDLREKFIITIDPVRARDFDDAISLEQDEQGRRVLGVHIADVSHFVRPGSALDKEARARGTSVYFPDRVLPMLPETLSNGLCSLRPGEDRLAFSVFITFDENAAPVARRCVRSVICSKHRLSYDQVLLALEERETQPLADTALDPALRAFLHKAGNLAQQLRRRRFGFHALDLDMPEYEVEIGPDSMIKDIIRRVSDQSHQLIEEFMVAANEAVDRELSGQGHALLHRVHEQPAPAKLEELIAKLKEMDFAPGDLSVRANMASFLRSIRGHPFEYDAQMAVLRSMKRAVYSHQALGHFGLAKKYYAHFTSPIRRYPDLVVHRILAAAIEGRPQPYRAGELEALALECSRTEQEADAAEKALIEIKKYRFLEQAARQEPPRLFDAVVMHAAGFGLFVELADLQVQGLVHISSLSKQYVRFDARRKELRAGSLHYERGARLKVRVAHVDFDRRKIDLVLAEQPDTNEKAPGAHKRKTAQTQKNSNKDYRKRKQPFAQTRKSPARVDVPRKRQAQGKAVDEAGKPGGFFKRHSRNAKDGAGESPTNRGATKGYSRHAKDGAEGTHTSSGTRKPANRFWRPHGRRSGKKGRRH